MQINGQCHYNKSWRFLHHFQSAFGHKSVKKTACIHVHLQYNIYNSWVFLCHFQSAYKNIIFKNLHNTCMPQHFKCNQKRNFSWIRQKTEHFPNRPKLWKSLTWAMSCTYKLRCLSERLLKWGYMGKFYIQL